MTVLLPLVQGVGTSPLRILIQARVCSRGLVYESRLRCCEGLKAVRTGCSLSTYGVFRHAVPSLCSCRTEWSTPHRSRFLNVYIPQLQQLCDLGWQYFGQVLRLSGVLYNIVQLPLAILASTCLRTDVQNFPFPFPQSCTIAPKAQRNSAIVYTGSLTSSSKQLPAYSRVVCSMNAVRRIVCRREVW